MLLFLRIGPLPRQQVGHFARKGGRQERHLQISPSPTKPPFKSFLSSRITLNVFKSLIAFPPSYEMSVWVMVVHATRGLGESQHKRPRERRFPHSRRGIPRVCGPFRERVEWGLVFLSAYRRAIGRDGQGMLWEKALDNG